MISKNAASLPFADLTDDPCDDDDDDDLTVTLWGHDTHFLERTARFEGAELARAMSLYHHSLVVRRLLPGLMDGHGAERAAIAVSDRAPSAHVIVTREGRFVTCLSAGMRPGGALVLPFSSFAGPLATAEAQNAQSAVRRRQLEKLPANELLRALLAGPGEVVREMVQVVEQQPLTYLIPVHIALTSAVQRLAKLEAAIIDLRAARRMNAKVVPRILRLARLADATVQLSLFLLGGMEEPSLDQGLADMVRNVTFLSEACGAALAMHHSGGQHLVEIMVDPDAEPMARALAVQSLGHHFVYHSRNIPAIARAVLAAELAPGTLPEAAFDVLRGWAALTPEEEEEAVLDLPPPSATPEVPIETAWLIDGGLRDEFAAAGARVSALFPPRALAGAVKEAWRRLMAVPLPHMVRGPQVKTVVREGPRVGRNAACPCGSGAKFKHCCLRRAPR